MIWDLQVFQETGFNKYFHDPSTTIATLLLDENIISQLKNQNPQLLQYLDTHKHQFISEMIEYTVVMPTQIDTYDRAHRLPYISSELLAIDSQLIYREFFKENEAVLENQYWGKLLALLDSSAAGNQVLMGYFEKVISNLYAGNKIKTTIVVGHSLDRFVKLLPNGSIADILKKCVVLLNQEEGVVLEQRKLILQTVVRGFVEEGEAVKAACADVLAEVVNKFQTFSSGDALIEELLTSEKLLLIYNIENSESVTDFLIALTKKTQQRIVDEHDNSVPVLSLPVVHQPLLDKYLKRQAESIRDISKSTGFILNQNKQTVRKSSKAMYSLLNLFGLVLQDGCSGFIDEGLVSFLWNLVVLYPYNNILHVVVKRIFMGILQGKEETVRECFLKQYESHILSLGKQHLDLLRPFMYSIWFAAKEYSQLCTDPLLLSQFQEFVATHFAPLLQYEIQNDVQKHSNAGQKLVVDEEDLAAGAKETEEVEKQAENEEEKVGEKVEEKVGEQVEEKVGEKPVETKQLSFEQLEKEIQNSDKSIGETQQNPPQQLKETVDLFSDFGESTSSKAPSEKQHPKQPQQDMFSNFTDLS